MFCFQVLRLVLLGGLVLSFGLFITCGIVDTWWTTTVLDQQAEIGLWRICLEGNDTMVCSRRANLMKFEDRKYFDIYNAVDMDIILVALACSAIGTLIHLAFVLRTMCQSPVRKAFIGSGVCFLFFAMATGVFSLVWALIRISSQNQGWAFYCLYAADGLCVISFVLSLLLLCMSSTRSSFNDDEIAMLKM